MTFCEGHLAHTPTVNRLFVAPTERHPSAMRAVFSRFGQPSRAFCAVVVLSAPDL